MSEQTISVEIVFRDFRFCKREIPTPLPLRIKMNHPETKALLTFGLGFRGEKHDIPSYLEIVE